MTSPRQRAREIVEEEQFRYARALEKPFVGAMPRFLREPAMASKEQVSKSTRFVSDTMKQMIHTSPNILILFGEDASEISECRGFLESAIDDGDTSTEKKEGKPTTITAGLAGEWLHTLPQLEPVQMPDVTDDQLLICIGNPSQYLSLVARLKISPKFSTMYERNGLVVVCRGICMMPVGTQEQVVYGVDVKAITQSIVAALSAKGRVAWGHDKGTKKTILEHAYRAPFQPAPRIDSPLTLKLELPEGDAAVFNDTSAYVKLLNAIKLARPHMPIANYYDTGLLVSVVMGTIVDKGLSLLTDRDGLYILRDASIGHTVSKLSQLLAVESYAQRPSIYNVFIGDGAARCNSGMETLFHYMEDYKAASQVTVVVFNNGKWAIEDALVPGQQDEHKLYAKDFYDVLGAHAAVWMCHTAEDLRAALSKRSEQTVNYVNGTEKASMAIIVVRGVDINFKLESVMGSLEKIKASPDLLFMKESLAAFSHGCTHRVPLYACSAMEYITKLQIFLEDLPEGKKYQFVAGRTDIQASQMCGFQQPDGKCVLFMNDIFGVHSLGESLRMVMGSFGGRQLLIMIWHPPLHQVIDHFAAHRPPMVWPSPGPKLCQYYVRLADDAFFFEFDGTETSPVIDAISSGKRLIVVNMLPQQERNYFPLDIRVPLPG